MKSKEEGVTKPAVKKTATAKKTPKKEPSSRSSSAASRADTLEPPRKRGRPKNPANVENPPHRKPGRPVNPDKQSVTVRTKLFDQSIVLAGGKILNRVRLERPANDALNELTEVYGTNRQAIESALVEHAKTLKVDK